VPFNFVPAGELAMVGQVLLAFVLGGVIGFEREASNKPAGLRTHMLVAGGTTMFTLASIYGFGGMRGGDPSRVAAQIVSGIGFLGGGTIFRSGSEVRGLTTAATIWLVAAIGMLVGTGLYALAVASTVIAAVVLRFLHRSAPKDGVTSRMQEDDAEE
jgi:putative Mg2+ transporter-C (MgtC) family protein